MTGFFLLPLFVILLGLAAVIGIAIALIRAATKGAKPMGEGLPMPYEVSAQTRNTLRPLRQVQESIEEITRKNPHNPLVSVVGMEAVAEARLLVEKAFHLAQDREKLSQIANRRTIIEQDLARLEMDATTQIGTPQGQAAAAKLKTAQLQLAQSVKAEQALSLLETSLAEAEGALVELREKLLASTLGGQIETASNSGELDSMVQRIKTLSRSLDEAEATLNERL
ncbi:MAG: hypothetical protein MUC92_06185 [Fimbriimonadaceae bacterium]|jgi:hypothetical protein|nr:hypothetical protein [Fimbriimonadaceae bacterium]